MAPSARPGRLGYVFHLRLAGLAAFVALAWVGCDGDGGDATSDGQAACREIVAAQSACDLLSDGDVDCRIFEVRHYGECAVECVRPASCEDMRAQACDDADNEYARCLDRCQAVLAVFECEDGTQLDSERACDGTPDCDDATDEADCDAPTFACGGGETVLESERCNGSPECGNGADEAGCPARAMTVCPGGF